MFHSWTADLPRYHWNDAVESDDAVMTSDEIKDNAVINDADRVAATFPGGHESIVTSGYRSKRKCFPAEVARGKDGNLDVDDDESGKTAWT